MGCRELKDQKQPGELRHARRDEADPEKRLNTWAQTQMPGTAGARLVLT